MIKIIHIITNINWDNKIIINKKINTFFYIFYFFFEYISIYIYFFFVKDKYFFWEKDIDENKLLKQSYHTLYIIIISSKYF